MPAVPKPVYQKTKNKNVRVKEYHEPIAGAFPKPRKFNAEENDKNAKTVVARDNGLCQWHYLVFDTPKKGSTPHHIHGRRRDWSERGQITLCFDCHTVYHTAKEVDGRIEITTEDLDNLIKVIYGEMQIVDWQKKYKARQ